MSLSVIRQRLSPLAAIIALAGIALLASGLWQVRNANDGVVTDSTMLGPTPVTVFRPGNEPQPDRLPVVVIAHGFAGSQQLMQPFAVTLAKNGYLAVSFDFLGHGRNRQPLSGNVTEVDGATRRLVEQTREIVDYALSLPAAGDDLAVLGHSMASDVVVRYSQSDERVDATVAVSMFSPVVTDTSPRNLLVIVGSLERFLREEAIRVLGLVTDNPQEAVTVGRFADGSARRVVFADRVEHVGVLYSRESMEEAVAWLDGVFDRTGSGYADSRGLAIVLVILGASMLVWPLARLLPVVSDPPLGASLRWRELLLAGGAPALATPILLWPFPGDFLGVLVGGYLALHFLVYGLISAACLWWLRRGQLTPPRGSVDKRALLLGCIVATAWVAGVFALILDSFVTSFAITGARLPLVLVMFAGTLSYFLADEWLTHGASTARGGHLFTRVCFLVSLGIAVALSLEELFFLLIIAAVIVVYFLVYGYFSKWLYRATGHPAVGAIANAVAFAWALTAVFPMMAGA